MNTLRHLLMGSALALALTTIAAPRSALAGDCPVCTTAADCTRPGSFCVQWMTSPGCGTVTRICCPGQGCALDTNGRPSCEADNRCTVVDGPSAGGDAGGGNDAATTSDAATTGDAAAAGDAATGDGGTTAPGRGCNCRVGAPSSASGRGALALGALGIASVMGARRRRR